MMRSTMLQRPKATNCSNVTSIQALTRVAILLLLLALQFYFIINYADKYSIAKF